MIEREPLSAPIRTTIDLTDTDDGVHQATGWLFLLYRTFRHNENRAPG